MVAEARPLPTREESFSAPCFRKFGTLKRTAGHLEASEADPWLAKLRRRGSAPETRSCLTPDYLGPGLLDSAALSPEPLKLLDLLFSKLSTFFRRLNVSL